MLKKSEKMISPGVCMMGRFRPCMCGTFVLFNNGEALILETPPGTSRNRPPWVAARRFIKRHKLNPLFMIASHSHWDHIGGFNYYRWSFKNTPFIAHESFRRQFRFNSSYIEFNGRIAEFSLGGEPLYIINAPKHSYEDMLVIFRGTVCTGDWTLGSMPDCNGIVSIKDKIDTMIFVREFLDSINYSVNTVYSAHGNDIRHGIDFSHMLFKMENYWKRKLKKY